jgi:hypothetical protein
MIAGIVSINHSDGQLVALLNKKRIKNRRFKTRKNTVTILELVNMSILVMKKKERGIS